MILSTDTQAERQKKIDIINSNFEALNKIKEDKANEIVNMLDLFKGELSLNDILNQDIPLLNSLRDVKIKSENKAAKDRGKAVPTMAVK